MTETSGREHLEKGRVAYADRAWADAYTSFADAARAEPLEPDDLGLLATSASMTGRTDEYLTVLERIHHAHLDEGDGLRAARAAYCSASPAGVSRSCSSRTRRTTHRVTPR
jgi:hypothetical protein